MLSREDKVKLVATFILKKEASLIDDTKTRKDLSKTSDIRLKDFVQDNLEEIASLKPITTTNGHERKRRLFLYESDIQKYLQPLEEYEVFRVLDMLQNEKLIQYAQNDLEAAIAGEKNAYQIFITGDLANYDFSTYARQENNVAIIFTADFRDDTGDFYINNVLFHRCEMGSDPYTYLSKAFHTEDGKVVDCHVSRETMQRLFRDLEMTKAVWSLFFKHYKGKIGEKFQEKDMKRLFTFRRQVTLGEARQEKLNIETALAEIAKRKEKSTS